MRITSTLLLIALAAFSAKAALPPFRSAPMHDHLLEVNAQWQSQDPALTRLSDASAFNDESERIRTHLLLVRERLAQRANNALAPAQRANRIALLQRLGDYANGRRFPSNHVLDYRNPVFIDPYGVACAVGWLMIESGHADLARSISKGFNLGYVHELIADARYSEAVGTWADDHGFTADELAWIQPGYPPSLPWQPLGGGSNGDVTVLEKLNDGRLLVAGAFTNAGGIAASQVAIWDGSAYEALGNGVQGDVTCAVEYNGSIYLGGAMLGGTSDLARWTGNAWEFSTVFDGKYPYISALHVHNGVLHAAGTVMGFAGLTEFVQRLNGATWEPVGSPFNGRVLTLASHDGMLIAGGEFTELAIPTEPIVRHVAQFNSTDWVNLAAGLDAPVRDLLSAGGMLYAGGDMINNIVPRFGLARLGAKRGQQEMLMPNLANYIFPALGDPRITCLAEENGNIYFGGSFIVSASMMTIGNNIARWSGVDLVLELAATDGETNAVCVHEAALVIGGEFELWQPHLSSLALTTRIDETPMISLSAAPNPVIDAVRLSGLRSSHLPRRSRYVTAWVAKPLRHKAVKREQ
ncbi:MAG: hypothetical protein IPJ85_13465 [Flavobacteriales bacterium]|nr:hypothetical protein [Flavobacteriales bacterium]